MSQESSAKLVLESLKAHLKLRGLSYRDLAKAWDLSESSVKRVMASDELSLSKIEKACELMDLPLGDFFKQINFEKNSELFFLSHDQELKLSKDPEALHYFLLISEGRNPTDIVREYSVSSEKNIRILNQLERWGLIELLPQNKIKRKFMGNLRFRKKGPLGKNLEGIVRSEFLQANFEREDEYFTFLNLNFLAQDFVRFKSRFLELAKELIAESDEHRDHPNVQMYGMIMAVRPWTSPLTQAFPKRKRQGQN
ncbi:helix-turn-helix domain-containing protein [Pseudobdellovibrio exovorus]|uniref:HTH cro/C1-type domain-containing protein n=1 Tax=Pseudobdellovibrio exovorus JSS TaxID=1184267 RepID=M4V5I4_9BACT|nr:helix-turn-helix domain-containing protein [Pseudobdellovibrio exovorus]AGH94602.1 hypothetical protein A11Q_382 [Pseudobdellovibrio exovorus JSS]